MAFLNMFFTISIFILHLQIIIALSRFYPIPDNPNVGDSVILKCRLTAPEGVKFKVTVPELTTGDILTTFSFNTIAQELNDTRYNGYHMPDFDLTELQGDITILFLRESDLNVSFSCLQELENGTRFELILNLSEVQNRTTTTTTTTTTQTVPQTCESLTPTCLPCELPETSDPPCFNQTVVDCSICIALGITSSFLFLLFSIFLLLIILVPIYFFKKYKNRHSYDVRTNVTQTSQSTPTSPSSQSIEKYHVITDTIIDCDKNGEGVEEVT